MNVTMSSSNLFTLRKNLILQESFESNYTATNFGEDRQRDLAIHYTSDRIVQLNIVLITKPLNFDML